MNIREKLANGIFEEEKEVEVIEYDIPEDNMFILKDMSKLNRMVKSQRARAHRAQVREIKLRRHTRGLHN